MTLRTRFLITALFLCHQLIASALVTSQLPSDNSAQSGVSGSTNTSKKVDAPSVTLAVCGSRAATQLKDGTILCSIEQEKVGELYQLHHDAEIHYRSYILRADEATYNSDSGEATATTCSSAPERCTK